MNKKHQEKIPSMKTYDNWPSRSEVARHRRLAVSQRGQVDKLSVVKRKDPDPIYRMVMTDRLRILEENRLKQTDLTLKSHLQNLKIENQKRSSSNIRFDTEGAKREFSPRIDKSCRTP